jgi:high-affinity K+ transport system ATPase subunit B
MGVGLAADEDIVATSPPAEAGRQATPIPRGVVEIADFALITRDGIVGQGCAEVDESAVTGNVRPVLKGVGARLLAGSRNGAGRLVMVPDEAPSSLPEAPRPQTPSYDLAGPFLQRFARRLLLVDLAAMAAAIVWLTSHGHSLTIQGLALVAIGLLPPGLLLVWPAQRLALYQWTRTHRIYCRSFDNLHDLLKIRRLVFGRHGTLSKGRLHIVSLQPAPGSTPAELMVLAASAHQTIEDIWGRAFLAFGISHRIHLRPVEKVTVEPGLGVMATIHESEVVVGQPEWLRQLGIAIDGLDEPIAEHHRLGRQMLFVGVVKPEPRCLGVIAFADPPRSGTGQLIKTCKQSGLETILVGDTSDPATATLAGLCSVGRVVPESESGNFDDADTVVVARSSEIGLLERYDNAVALGEIAMRKVPMAKFGIQRDDTRHVLDFIVLAQILARRLPLTLALVWISGWPLIVDGLGLFVFPTEVRFGCLIAGILIAIVQPQLLRLVDSLANDEHED